MVINTYIIIVTHNITNTDDSMPINVRPLEEISGMLRDNRRTLGLSQKRLASMCGLSQSTIARIETDITRLNPSYQTVFEVADALGSMGNRSGGELLSRNAGEIMHRRIIHIMPNNTISDAINTFIDYDFPQLPVLDSARHVVGTVYQKDVLSMATQAPDLVHSRKVGGIMKGALPQIDRSTPVTKIKPMLETVGAVIVAHDGKAVGIITIYDILKNV
jgi:predicted transcriptional regulator